VKIANATPAVLHVMTKNHVSRRTALKVTAGVVGGLALDSGMASPVAAQQSLYYRYDEMEAQLVNVDTEPPEFRRVRTSLFLPESRLGDCTTDDPRSIDVLDFQASIHPDDNDHDGDLSDDDDGCPDYGSVTLLCHGPTESDAIALTGLVSDIFAPHAEEGYDYVIRLNPTDDTNVSNPETVPNPCPAHDETDGDDTGGQDDGQGDDDDSDENSGRGGDDGQHNDDGTHNNGGNHDA